MKILALECATEHCSAALWIDGAVRERVLPAGRGQSGQLLAEIESLLAEAQLPLGSLDLLAAGRGPGAFTGVRLAASIAQGLAYAASLPVLPVSTLRAVAQAAYWQSGERATHVLVCQDARMAEVYWGTFAICDGIAAGTTPEQLSVPGVVSLPESWTARPWMGAGSGFAAYAELAARWAGQQPALLPDCHPAAGAVAVLAAHDGLALAVAAAAFQPVYLRNNVATVPSQP